MDPLQKPEAMIATIARICEREKRTVVVEVLRNCAVELEQTNYDNWNGGTYDFFLDATPSGLPDLSHDAPPPPQP
jgi:hypothetical protein